MRYLVILLPILAGCASCGTNPSPTADATLASTDAPTTPLRVSRVIGLEFAPFEEGTNLFHAPVRLLHGERFVAAYVNVDTQHGVTAAAVSVNTADASGASSTTLGHIQATSHDEISLVVGATTSEDVYADVFVRSDNPTGETKSYDFSGHAVAESDQ